MWIDTGKGTERAYLATISDSVLYFSANPVSFTPDLVNTASYSSINYSSIKKVRVVKKGSSAKGFRIGLLTGVDAGALIGFASGDDKDNCFICFTAAQKALFGVVYFGVMGGITGGISGLKEKKFSIKNKKSNFVEMKLYMQKKIVRSTPESPK